MDSGVETGNDSNDSLVIQHDNRITLMESIEKVKDKNEELLPDANKASNPSTSLDIVSTYNSGSHCSLALIPADKVNTSSLTLNFQIPPMFNSEYSLPSHLHTGKYLVPSYKKSFKSNRMSVSHRYRINGGFPPLPKKCSEKLESLEYLRTPQEPRYSTALNQRKMRFAATTNNIEVMNRLLQEGVSPNNFDEQAHRSPLHLASSRGYTEMVSLLLSYGADPNQRDCVGNTPLHLAAVTGKISVVTLLLTAGTDVLSSDRHGYNPLQLAQTKLRMLQNCKDADANGIKDEVRNVIGMLLVYLQKQKDAHEQMEALNDICSRLSLSSTSDQLQDDVKTLLANVNSLSLTN